MTGTHLDLIVGQTPILGLFLALRHPAPDAP